MSYYVRVGDVPRKRHIWHRGADGRRLAEELMGEEGFSGASSLLYHLHSPSAITGVEPWPVARSPLTPNDPLLPWHLEAHRMRGRRRPGHRPPGAARQRQCHHLLGNGRSQQRAVSQRGRRRARLLAGRLGELQSVFGSPRGRGGGLRGHPGLHDPPLGSCLTTAGRPRCGLWSSKRPATSASRRAT